MPTKYHDYCRRHDVCASHAERSPSEEIRALWLQIAASYRFLSDREIRLGAEEKERDAISGQHRAAALLP